LPTDGSTLGKRLETITERWALPQASVSRLEELLVELARDSQAPTAVKDPLRGAEVHVADSLSVFQLEGFRGLRSLVDIGSGAGFPGLVLALAMPDSSFDLLEVTMRKCEFLERMLSRLGIENARVVCERAETWGADKGAEAYSGAVVRAVGLLPTLLEYASPLLERGGRLVALKGRRDPDEERQAGRAATVLGMRALGVEWVGAYAGSRNRHLHSYEKVAACPARFPRRPGMARKRPLGR
jgi:16S rRNA (guanine527-N7)-methyltransferase